MAAQVAASTVRITKQAKLSRAGALIALGIAKESNDPMYSKYSAAKEKYTDLKEKLIAKYKSKAKRKLGANF